MTNTNPEGVDVSNHQGVVDWQAVANSGRRFAYIKATEGTGFTDPTFLHNWDECEKVGILPGAYHYWRPDVDPTAQIDHFKAVYGTWDKGELPPCLDVEADTGQYAGLTSDQLILHVDTCLKRMEELCGRKPVVYTYPYFWHGRMANTDKFKEYPLWLAAYPSLPKALPGGWASVTIHQYSSTGNIPGSPLVDLDRWVGKAGTLDELKAFCGLGGTHTDPLPGDNRFFPQTGHYVGHGFRDKWEEYERLGKAMECIGYPITEEVDDGTGLTVQYFERARFEYHAELNPPQVLFGRVGYELYNDNPLG